MKQRQKSYTFESGNVSKKIQSFIPLSFDATSQWKVSYWALIKQEALDTTDAIFLNTSKKLNDISHINRSLLIGDKIQAHVYKNNNEIWKFDIVTRQLNSR